ncbi:hypothetical protein LCGC14_2607370 [marine sediment metagenome]|uniref:HNH domain-containing protein n=1 Tax=marine sediment metagenome TaxID=412755 RepID=A0A0F9CZP4_9ZZZZ
MWALRWCSTVCYTGSMETVCSRCGKTYDYRPATGVCKTLCHACMVWRGRQRRKARALEYKGGKCQQCGYNKCAAALQFHHTKPEEKTHTISYLIIRARPWEVIKTELDKCIVLCANCHAEVSSSASSGQW